MLRIVVTAIIAAALLYGQAEACVDRFAVYYTGLVLNNGETINFPRIATLATNGNAYIKECFEKAVPNGDSTERCSYKFRSFAKTGAMVHLGYSEGESGLDGNVPRMLIFFDTITVPSKEDKAIALAAELQRFSSLGIITISDAAIATAASAIKVFDGQYWTNQDTVLPYNAWFEGSSKTVVRSIKDPNTGCGAGVAYELPDGAFAVTNIDSAKATMVQRVSGALLRSIANEKEIRFTFAPVAGNRARLVVDDIAGHRILSVSLEKSASVLSINRANLVAGSYVVSVEDDGSVVQSGRLVISGR